MKPEYLNDDDLEKAAPGLSKLKNENPFRVPENYCESLAEDVQKKIHAFADLERMNKENPFQVPENYFSALPTLVQQRIIDGKKKRPVFGKWISISLRPKYALAFAAVIILLIFGIKYITKPTTLHAPEKYLSMEELQSSSYLAELDESMLIDVLEQQTNSDEVNDNDTLEQYLMDNGIDISQIENNL